MIVIAGGILGGAWGGWLARRRGGSTADVVQYAAVYGLIFAVAGLALTIFLERMG